MYCEGGAGWAHGEPSAGIWSFANQDREPSLEVEGLLPSLLPTQVLFEWDVNAILRVTDEPRHVRDAPPGKALQTLVDSSQRLFELLRFSFVLFEKSTHASGESGIAVV